MRVRISEIQESDKNQLRELYFEVRKNHFHWLDEAALKSSSFDTDAAGEYILVAKADDKVVGFASVWMPDNFVHHLYVATSYQGKGIGTQLLDEVISRISSPITLKCVKRNTSAARFYLRNGWAPKFEANSKEGTYILFEYVKRSP